MEWGIVCTSFSTILLSNICVLNLAIATPNDGPNSWREAYEEFRTESKIDPAFAFFMVTGFALGGVGLLLFKEFRTGALKWKR